MEGTRATEFGSPEGSLEGSVEVEGKCLFSEVKQEELVSVGSSFREEVCQGGPTSV